MPTSLRTPSSHDQKQRLTFGPWSSPLLFCSSLEITDPPPLDVDPRPYVRPAIAQLDPSHLEGREETHCVEVDQIDLSEIERARELGLFHRRFQCLHVVRADAAGERENVFRVAACPFDFQHD